MGIPARAVAIAAPFFGYFAAHRAITHAPAVILLQLIPTLFQIVLPQYTVLPAVVVVVGPLIAAVVDRLVLYGLLAVLPETADAQIRSVAVYVASSMARR